MKKIKNNKTKFSVLLSLVFAFALVFTLAFSLPFAKNSSFAEGETVSEKIEINFVNKSDLVLSGENEFSDEIYYNKTTNRLEDKNGQEIDLNVKTNDALFTAWFVYNVNSENNFEQLGSDYGASFKLLKLVQKIYASENNENYVVDGKISLLSVRVNNTVLTIDQSVNDFGKLYVSGVLVENKITLDFGTEYSFKIVPKNNYALTIAKIYGGADFGTPGSDPKFTSANKNFTFATTTLSNYTIAAEYEKINYVVNFLAVDRSMVAYADMTVSSYLDIVATTGKVDETLKNKVTISSDNNYRFFACKIMNNQTNSYEEFDLRSVQENNQVLGADFYDKYASNGKVDVYVVFDKLYQIKVSATGEGEFAAYVNQVPVSSEKIIDGVLTTYVSAFEKVEIYALPGKGSIIANVENVSSSELENGKITLQDISENREIKINFDEQFYVLKVYAFDNKDERLSQYDMNSIIYVNGVKTNKIRIGDKITRIETIVGSLNADYKIQEYQIFNKIANRFVPYNEGLKFDETYVTEGTENVLYVKAIYTRQYRASVYIDELSKGSGYFTVEILNSAWVLQNRYDKKTEFNMTLSAGTKVRVTAYSYRGYAFNKFTLENENPADKEIITKSIENEDVSLGLVYEKSDVNVKIESTSEHAKTQNLSSNKVQIGDKITIAYKLDFSYELKNVYINKVRADKLDNVHNDGNSIVIDVTKEFLSSLDKNGNINVEIKTVRDGSYISFVIVIPIILVLIAGAAAVSVVYFIKAKKKRDEIDTTEIENK